MRVSALLAVLAVSFTLSAQVVNDKWMPAEGPVAYAIPILDHATLLPQELAIHYFTNLARMGYDCNDVSLKCGMSETLTILSFDFRLATAARWFSKHLNDTPCFQHDTCCTLTLTATEVLCVAGTACTDQPCDVTYCAGTPWVQRITMFGGNPTAENLAAGNDTADETICQWMNSPGHRTNICSPSNTSLGTGYYQGQNCYYRYWTQDFGGGAQAERLYPGALFDDGSLLKAGLIVRSPSPVKTAVVTVGTVETALANTFGTDLRGAWTATVSAANCAAYFFTASFNDGKSERFPPAGYLFYSDTPAECEGPDGDPDIDTALPDDTIPDDAASDDEGADTTEEPDDETPDEGSSSDSTSPFDFNPSKDDAGPSDEGPVDIDLVWPDDTKPADGGCGCGLVF